MTAAKTVSIVLASYNGIKFIGEQLDSILAQTRLPDEVIISDDCSTDGTYEFCRDYILEHKLKGWHVFRNESNLGHRKNFRQALLKCTGDYVFTCDQDDIWMPDKIEAMVRVLNARPEIQLLVSNFIPLLENNTREKRTLYMRYVNRHNDGSVIQLKFDNQYLTVLRPGCTYCFRHKLLDNFKIMDIPQSYHDVMITRYAILQNGLYLLNRKLIYWRRHNNNSTLAFKPKYDSLTVRVKRVRSEMENYREFLAASKALGIPEHNSKVLREATKFFENRTSIIEKRNPFSMVLFVIMNFRLYPSIRSALGDIYAVVFRRE